MSRLITKGDHLETTGAVSNLRPVCLTKQNLVKLNAWLRKV